jgi:hypothetical protein
MRERRLGSLKGEKTRRSEYADTRRTTGARMFKVVVILEAAGKNRA